MTRRRPPPDPEVLALARDRLARLLGGPGAGPGGSDDGSFVGPRRAVRGAVRGVAPEPSAAPASPPGRDGRSVALDDLEQPQRFTRWHLGVVALVLLVGVVWGGWAWLRARPEAVAAPTVVTTAGPPASASAASAGAASAGAGSPAATPDGAALVVHVLGAVRHPGLVRLPAGARVEDALEQAGGLRRDADPAELNLAEPLADGVQVVVGTTRHPAGEVRASGSSGGGGSSSGASSGSSGSGSTGSSGSTAVVDLNHASADQLETLPGVGPVTAQKIVDWRTRHGRFTRVEELQEVDGIGPKTYARIAPHARV